MIDNFADIGKQMFEDWYSKQQFCQLEEPLCVAKRSWNTAIDTAISIVRAGAENEAVAERKIPLQ